VIIEDQIAAIRSLNCTAAVELTDKTFADVVVQIRTDTDIAQHTSYQGFSVTD
jgi:hypothetical protein